MRFQKFFEFNQKDLEPIKSFYIKDELNSKLWSDFKLDQDVRENLLKIARDFFETLDTECEVKDIALCGSLCNYNWSEKYSDYDLHIIIDFRDIDENVELVEKFCDYAKKQWNSNHDITLKGYEVEVAIQDEKDLKTAISSGRMGGVFSLMKNKWTKKPEKVEFIPDEKTLERKATVLMDTIDELEEEVDEDKYPKFKEKIDRLWKKIKKYRQSGLEEEGEYSTGNLLFKLLRRNGYISKVMDLKKKSYDMQFESKFFSFFVNDQIPEHLQKKYYGLDREDIKDILTTVTDELDMVDVSINFATDRGFMRQNQLEYLDKSNSLKIQIHFWLTEEYTSKHSMNIDTTEIIEKIDEHLDLGLFKNLGYTYRIDKRTIVDKKFIVNLPGGQIGPTVYSIFLSIDFKKLN